MRDQSAGLQGVDVDLRFRIELAGVNRSLQAANVHCGIVLFEDIIETTLRKTPVQRHLTALEPFDGDTATRLLALVAGTGRLAGSRTNAAADAFSVLPGTWIIGQLIELHVSLPCFSRGRNDA
jgi:hypothetical protein